MKEVDETPLPESKSEDDPDYLIAQLLARVLKLEKDLALFLEQRVTVRAPEANDDPEWF